MIDLKLGQLVCIGDNALVAVQSKREGFEMFYVIEIFPTDKAPLVVATAWSERYILTALNDILWQAQYGERIEASWPNDEKRLGPATKTEVAA